MKTKTLLFILTFAAIFCSCNREKPYTIHGTLDLPDQVPYGDTIIDVPSFNGTWVYLLDLDNQLIDSVMIDNDEFDFKGVIRPSDAYYAQFVSQLGSSLIAIEPGDIDVYIDGNITISGTPSNDAMADVDAAMQNLNSDTYEYLSNLTDSLRANGEELSDIQQMKIAQEFQNTLVNTLDSLYQQNKENLGGAYAVLMRHMDTQTSEEYENIISTYPEDIQNNELVQFNLRMIRQYETLQQYDTTDQLDSLLLKPEELAPAQ